MSSKMQKLVKKTFKHELQLIKEIKIREMVINTFDQLANFSFFTAPASSTGKNHPRNCCREGGLVLHVKTCVWWLEQIMKMQDGLLPLKDHAVAALLIHDMHKDVNNHGAYTAAQMYELNSEDPDYALIQLAVATHMGRWGTPKPTDLTDMGQRAFCHLVHLADYCASRHFDEIAQVTRPALTHSTLEDLRVK